MPRQILFIQGAGGPRHVGRQARRDGTDDTTVPFAHVKLYAKAIPRAIVRALPNRDHQLCNDLRDVAQDIESPGIRKRLTSPVDEPTGWSRLLQKRFLAIARRAGVDL